MHARGPRVPERVLAPPRAIPTTLHKVGELLNVGFDMQDLFAQVTVTIHVKSMLSPAAHGFTYKFAKSSPVSVLAFNSHLQRQAAKEYDRSAERSVHREWVRTPARNPAESGSRARLPHPKIGPGCA